MKTRGALRERIIRTLLVEPNGTLTKYKLAKLAESSFTWTHEFLNKLQTQKLVKGTQVTNYTGLINYWLKIKISPEEKDYMHKTPLNLFKQLNFHTPSQLIKQKISSNTTFSLHELTFT